MAIPARAGSACVPPLELLVSTAAVCPTTWYGVAATRALVFRACAMAGAAVALAGARDEVAPDGRYIFITIACFMIWTDQKTMILYIKILKVRTRTLVQNIEGADAHSGPG